MTVNITVTGGNGNTIVAFKNCAPFRTCRTEVNVFVDEAIYIYIAMHMYNLIEYSDNYSDTSGSLWQLKRDEIDDNAEVTVNLSSFKYESDLIGNLEADGKDERVNNTKIALPLKYLNNFWRSLEIPLINSKVGLSLTCGGECILSGCDVNNAGVVQNAETAANFKIADAKLYVLVVTLSIEDNVKLTKQ